MASPIGPDLDALRARLTDKPYAFSFFQAVRRLECAHMDRPRVGFAQRPSHDPARFCQIPSLVFAPSTVARYDTTASGADRMYSYFFGLLGPNGPMPLHLTEYVHDRELHHDDSTIAAFMDVFHHRMYTLFYRAWASAQIAVSHDRPGEDRFGVYVASVIGRGTEAMRDRDKVSDVAKQHYSGRLACPTKNAEGLRAIIADYFQLSCELVQFIGRWMDIPQEAQCKLGASRDTGTLGSSVIAGKRIYECQQSFRLRLGPMNLARYESLLPTALAHHRLVDWVKNYLSDELMYDIQLILFKEEVPEIKLGTTGRLGWTTWLQSKPLTHDADDLYLRPTGS